jgi:hypothetical protein
LENVYLVNQSIEKAHFLDRISPFRWYRFQNSRTERDNGLKFCMVIVLGKLEDHVGCFQPGSVHKWRKLMSIFLNSFKRLSLRFLPSKILEKLEMSTLYWFFKCLRFFYIDVICGRSQVGSNPRGPPAFQALSPYQISSQYLFRFSSSGSDTIEMLIYGWKRMIYCS